jgi:hypothetical protein
VHNKEKGDLAETRVLADIVRRGHKVAIPFGEHWRYDLVMQREGRLERVQVKYVKSTAEGVLTVKCHSMPRTGVRAAYTPDEIDWLAVYDATTDRVFYIPSDDINGQHFLYLRLTPTKNRQARRVHWAADYEDL